MEKMQLQKPFLVNWLLPIVMKFEYNPDNIRETISRF